MDLILAYAEACYTNSERMVRNNYKAEFITYHLVGNKIINSIKI